VLLGLGSRVWFSTELREWPALTGFSKSELTPDLVILCGSHHRLDVRVPVQVCNDFFSSKFHNMIHTLTYCSFLTVEFSSHTSE
jgi:hypothetical protein